MISVDTIDHFYCIILLLLLHYFLCVKYTPALLLLIDLLNDIITIISMLQDIKSFPNYLNCFTNISIVNNGPKTFNPYFVNKKSFN